MFYARLRCFGGKSFAALIDPARVAPTALDRLAAQSGVSLFTSDALIVEECLRLVALSGLRAATSNEVDQALKQQESWMLRLGQLAAAH
jgi:hypothetical protein